VRAQAVSIKEYRDLDLRVYRGGGVSHPRQYQVHHQSSIGVDSGERFRESGPTRLAARDPVGAGGMERADHAADAAVSRQGASMQPTPKSYACVVLGCPEDCRHPREPQ
jgi:hypothetical protein